MDKCIHLSCNVIVYYGCDRRNVEAASSNVGGYDNISALWLLNGFNGFEPCFLLIKPKKKFSELEQLLAGWSMIWTENLAQRLFT